MIRDRHLTDLRWLGLHLRRQLQGTESGRAIVEFVFLGTLLLVPLVYLIMTLAQVQAAAYGATAAAREAGRAFTTAATEVQGMPRARAAAQVAFMDFGFTDQDASVVIVCDGSPCLRPVARVTATSTIQVRLPFVPAFVGEVIPTTIPVSVTHVATVDRFGGR